MDKYSEKVELTFIAGAEWYSHFGNSFDSVL